MMDVSYIKGLKIALRPSKNFNSTLSFKGNKHKNKKKQKMQKNQSKNALTQLDSEIQSSMFRFLNEKFYKCNSVDALKYFSEEPSAFQLYHRGFQKQLRKWPSDPLKWPEDIIKSEFNSCVVADLGCGDARLAFNLNGIACVHSFDLVAVNERVTACDMARTPLAPSSIDVAVFCLALMGINCRDFIFEANRILKPSGTLLIVEVASRFESPFKDFLKHLKPFGFKTSHWEITTDTYFARARLDKIKSLSNMKVTELPNITLNPCLYKKR